MKTYTATIKELAGKPRSELNAIFKNASDIAVATNSCALEKLAADRTINIVRILLSRLDP